MARPYRNVHVAWNDPEAVRAYNREAQALWRAKHVPRKGDRGQRALGGWIATDLLARVAP